MKSAGIRWHRGKTRWPLIAFRLVFGLVCAIAAASIGVKSGEPWWGAPFAAAIGFVGVEGVKELNRCREVAEERAGIRRSTDVGGSGGRRYPRVRQLSLEELGARPPLVQIPYRPRPEVEQGIRKGLGAGRAVLVIGPSMVGKSRVVAEVLRDDYPDRPIWRPGPPEGLATLLEHGAPHGMVILLDDLENHFKSTTLRSNWVSQLTDPKLHNIVVATIRSTAMEKAVSEEDTPHPQSRIVREAFARVSFDDDHEADKRIAARLTDQSVAAGVENYGLGVYLGGGHIAVDRYELGTHTHPLGVAMIRLAVEWRRIGLDYVPATVLGGLAKHYLPPIRQEAPRETEENALAWATGIEQGIVQLLTVHSNEDAYRVTDYLFDHILLDLPGHLDDIPDHIWDTAASVVTEPPDRYYLAVGAHDAGRRSLAAELYRRVIDSSHSKAAPLAMAGLGTLEEKAGNLEEARGWHRKVIDSGDPELANSAMLHLGDLERGAGNFEEGRGWHRQAIDAGDPEAATWTMLFLGRLEGDAGNPEAARSWYRQVIDSGHREVATWAMVHLGSFERDAENFEEARSWYCQVIDSGHPELAARAMVNVGYLEAGVGNLHEARGWYRKVIDSGHPEMPLKAMIFLGDLEMNAGNVGAARGWYEKVIDSGHPEAVPFAMIDLGALEAGEGEVEAARSWYHQAIDTGHPEVSPDAEQRLRELPGE